MIGMFPIVRTSPDHGTAFDLAGQNKANPQSMISSIYLAVDVVRNREKYVQMHANPLKVKEFSLIRLIIEMHVLSIMKEKILYIHKLF